MHKGTVRFAPLLFIFILALTCVSRPVGAAEPAPVIHQLRVYEIFDKNKQAFHARFREHAMRIMAKYDFKILAIWETQHNGRTEFVYLLQWPDRATLTDRWAKFMADPEWAAIKKRTAAQHGQMVGEIQDRVLDVQDYSPTHTFAIPVSL
jgi:hypothetical protein